jgi:hypothetical protein
MDSIRLEPPRFIASYPNSGQPYRTPESMPLKSKQLIAAAQPFPHQLFVPQAPSSPRRNILLKALTPASFNPQYSGRT